MKALPVSYSNGVLRCYATVDDEDYDFVSQWQWRLTSKGYVFRTEGRKEIRLHRSILGLPVYQKGDLIVDHKDRNPLNNQRDNLRLVTKAQNQQNRSSYGITSRYRGVYRTASGKFRAKVQVNRKAFGLGTFESEEEAAEVARKFRLEHLPFSVED